MAGGKKKSMANKLAKMSDEERARYLQHKADMEEEAKRRKEQLIATFMKKKLKKEDAFARLNVAKINQNWHQILRKAKCKEMIENVEHLKIWIDRLLSFKNRTISKLMKELEEAEEQYSNNFQNHSSHIDKIIDDQHAYIEKLEKEYDDDLSELLGTTEAEQEYISTSAQSDEEHLKTIIYAQGETAGESLRQEHENCMIQLYETECNFQLKLQQMQGSREATIGDLWRQIATVVRLYVQQTDSRRMHFAELGRLDAESAREIAANEERIRSQEELIQKLQHDYDFMLSERQVKINVLESEAEELNKTFLRVRKTLQKELQIDEKKIFLLTECCANVTEYFEKLTRKGDHIKNLGNICKKFETEREEVARWLPAKFATTKGDSEEIDLQEELISEQVSSVGSISNVLPPLELPLSEVPRRKASERPKTSVSSRFTDSARSVAISTPKSSKHSLPAFKGVTIQSKPFQQRLSFPSSSPDTESSITRRSILHRCITSLEGMENFWSIFNKVKIDYMEIKEEKKMLENENKQLRGMMRSVLEAVVLSPSVPNTRVSTRLSKRTVQSAPLRRVVLS